MNLLIFLKLVAILGFILEHTDVPEENRGTKRKMNETLMDIFADLVAESGNPQLLKAMGEALDEAIAEADKKGEAADADAKS
jgi:tetrahydromethanopterin S-methyltransferase subunit H